MRTPIKTILLMCLSAGLLLSQAQAAYVSDELVITLRTGAGNQFQILKSLKAGTRLELVESENGWSRVRVPEFDLEGWVLSRYITQEPTAALKLVRAERRAAKLQQENEELKTQLNALSSEKGELETNWKQLSSKSTNLSKELEHLKQISKRPVELAEENKTLKRQTTEMENELEMVKQKNQALEDRANRDWFLAGAGVVIVGIIIGLIIPKLRTGRRSGGWGGDL